MYPWAPNRKPGTAFLFYRFSSGEAWVLYSLTDGAFAITPWPAAVEGWDEALPSSVGVADLALGIYRAVSMSTAMFFLSRNAKASRVTTNPQDFQHL